jgi:hypothetical protein
MIRFFTYIPILIAWLPKIIEAVTVIEAVLDPKTSGPEKKHAVLAYLSDVAKKTKLPWGDQAIQVIDSVIDTVVGILNFLRIFTHRGDKPAEVVEAPAAVTPAAVTERVADAMKDDPVLDAFLGKKPLPQ